MVKYRVLLALGGLATQSANAMPLIPGPAGGDGGLQDPNPSSNGLPPGWTIITGGGGLIPFPNPNSGQGGGGLIPGPNSSQGGGGLMPSPSGSKGGLQPGTQGDPDTSNPPPTSSGDGSANGSPSFGDGDGSSNGDGSSSGGDSSSGDGNDGGPSSGGGSSSSGAKAGKLPVEWSGAAWFGHFSIGGQQLSKMCMDTGSSDLWVRSSNTQGVYGGSGGTYNPSGEKLPGGSFEIHYGDGSAAAGNDIVFDTVAADGGLSVPGQAVECASQRKENDPNHPMTGLMGMAFGAMNAVKQNGQPAPQKTLWETAGFGYFTCHLGPPDNNDIWFGIGYDDKQASGGQQLQYVNMDSGTGFYRVDSQTLTVNGQQIQNAISKSILDTGTTMVYVEAQTAQAVYASISGSSYQNGNYWYPCDATPNVQIAIGNQMLQLDPDAFNMQSIGRANGLCVGAIQPATGAGQGQNIYGSAIFRSAYWRFEANGQGGRVGFAPYKVGYSGGNNGGNGPNGSNGSDGNNGSNGGAQGPDGSQGGMDPNAGQGGQQGGLLGGFGGGNMDAANTGAARSKAAFEDKVAAAKEPWTINHFHNPRAAIQSGAKPSTTKRSLSALRRRTSVRVSTAGLVPA